MSRLKRFFEAANHWQGRHRWFAVPWAVQQKFSDDQANMFVVALGWYGFTAIYPLLLMIITVFGFIGVGSLGSDIVNTLHRFPVIGSQFTPGQGGSNLHGSPFALIIGVVGLLYGAQGVTQTAQSAMNHVWNVPQMARPGFLPRLVRSLTGLACIGVAFIVNAFLGSLATAGGRELGVRIGIVIGQLLLNVLFFLVSFRVLLAKGAEVGTRSLVPGAVAGAVFFTALITIGTGLIQHQLRNEGAVYGAFASVIGVVTFLLLLSKLTLYSAELNPVLTRRLYPRALPMTEPLPADRRGLKYLAHEERRRPDEQIGVGFDPNGSEQAEDDANHQAAERASHQARSSAEAR
jgi:uncharacterized BrkB/YihY/UPF0761 family membrane protein